MKNSKDLATILHVLQLFKGNDYKKRRFYLFKLIYENKGLGNRTPSALSSFPY